MKKTCSKCGIEKELSEFNISKINKGGFRGECKNCQKIYRDNNKEKLSKQRKEYYQKNKLKESLQNKKYRKSHKIQINEYDKKYKNEKKKNDINYLIKTKLRTRLSQALKRNQKFGKTLNLLGCSIEQFKIYLESQFTKGMNWDNYGIYGWHIDHKKPCAKFDLSKPSEQYKCFHYSNLQPLWAIDNLKKGSKYVLKQS